MSIDNPTTYEDCRVAAHYADRCGDWAKAHKLARQASKLAPSTNERNQMSALAKIYRHAAEVALQFNFDPRVYP